MWNSRPISRLPWFARLFFLSTIGLLVGACGGAEDGEVDTSAADAVTFTGELEPLKGFSFDTGLIPAGSPVAASLKLAAGGKVKVTASAAIADGHLTGNKGGGDVSLDVHFTMAGRLKIDSPLKKVDEELPGLKNIDVPITGKVAFDPFLLDGSPSAAVVGAIPETKLPPIPLGSVPGKLQLTVTKDSTVRSSFHGSCLSVAGGKATYQGQLETSGTLVLKGTIVVDLPPPLNTPVDLGVISVQIPESTSPLDLGTRPTPGVEDARNGSACATTGAGSTDGGTDSATTDTKKTFGGTLAQTSPPVAYGGPDDAGGGAYCNYAVTLQGVSVTVTLDGTKIVAATVSDQAVETVDGSCPYPPSPPGAQAFTLPNPTPIGMQLVLDGDSANKPKASLTVDLVASGAGYDATLRWHRTDLGPPLDWRVIGEVHLLPK
ncbi:MAG TPA: hypothetical protein VLT33_51250 [Labilithrix sp.]|nr:hypothetical protein [Labilithrix sp.]